MKFDPFLPAGRKFYLRQAGRNLLVFKTAYIYDEHTN